MDALLSRLIAKDTARLAEVHRIDWSSLHGGSLLMTGCTGPFGWWLLHKLSHACEHEDLRLQRLTLLTRNANRVKSWAEYLHPALRIQVYEADIRDVDQLGLEATHVVHGATTSAAETSAGATAIEKFETVVDGTRALIRGLEACRPNRILYLSSGIAYGNNTEVLTGENCGLAPDTTEVSAALGHAKRAAEFLMSYAAERWSAQLRIARCFSFSGPGMPLNAHYALGNFVQHAVNEGEIVIRGDGKLCRSYMHLGDLAIWLAKMLTHIETSQKPEIYNVGSDQCISLIELATLVSNTLTYKPNLKVMNLDDANLSGNQKKSYVPRITKARKKYSLKIWTPLEDSAYEMVKWANDIKSAR